MYRPETPDATVSGVLIMSILEGKKRGSVEVWRDDSVRGITREDTSIRQRVKEGVIQQHPGLTWNSNQLSKEGHKNIKWLKID